MESFSNIFLAVTVYAVLHSLLASNGMKALAERRLGLFAQRHYRLLYNLVAAVSLVPVLWVVWRSPDYPLYLIPAPIVFFSLLLQVVAVGCALYSLRQTGIMDFLGLAAPSAI